MTGAQKCTVLMPMGLSHMRLNQLCCAPPSAVVLCHLRLHSWRRYAARKGEARWKAWRAWKADEVEEKTGRAARAKVDEGGILCGWLWTAAGDASLFFLFFLSSFFLQREKGREERSECRSGEAAEGWRMQVGGSIGAEKM